MRSYWCRIYIEYIWDRNGKYEESKMKIFIFFFFFEYHILNYNISSIENLFCKTNHFKKIVCHETEYYNSDLMIKCNKDLFKILQNKILNKKFSNE